MFAKKKKNSSTKTTVPPLPKLPYTSKQQKKKSLPSHPVGAVLTENEAKNSYHQGIYARFTQEQIQPHTPQYQAVPYSGGTNPRPFSAAQIQSFRKRSKNNVFFPKFFMNPYQDLDYIVLQDIYANAIAGRIIDRLVELMFGNGVKPVLKLRNPKEFGDEESQQKEIEKGQKITDDVMALVTALKASYTPRTRIVAASRTMTLRKTLCFHRGSFSDFDNACLSDP